MSTCFDDETVLGLVEGRLDPAALAAADEHLDDCVTCRALVTQLARGTDEPVRAIDHPLARGRTLGRYVIGDVLGSGAWGRVYSAWEPELDRRVAVKVLRDRGAHERVLREAQAMAKLDHPNVVGVHEVGTTDDAVYVVMELVDGETLRTWATRPRTWREVARVLGEVARGLAAVHAAGLVHRDVKPDNIIVGRDGRARLGDFGLARASPSTAPIAPGVPGVPVVPIAQTRAGGTPVYMAPELLAGGPATPASDQFALGVTAYEVLARKRPFTGDTLARLAEAMARTPTPPPGPAWLAAAIRRCLARDPAARFDSCGAVADQLAGGVARRRPFVLVAGIAAAAIVASGATYVATHRAEPGASPPVALVITPTEVAALPADLVATIDRWAAGWRVARNTPEPAPIARACLDARADELHALLARPGVTGLPGQARLADALDALPPSECLTLTVDDRDPVPLDPDRAAAVARVVRGLPGIRAALVLGDARDVATTIDALVDAAGASTHAPTVAEAGLVAAEVARVTGRLPEAEARATAAFAAALRGHAGQLVAEVAVERVAIAGDRRELAAADELATIADAAIAAVHAPPRLAVRLARQHALVAYNAGAYGKATAILARARGAALGGDLAAIDSALGSAARAAGDLDEADRRHAGALELDRRLHPDGRHPDLARDLHNLAGVARLRGQLERATALYLQALAIELALRGPTSVEVGLTRNSLGLVALARGDLATARRELEAARTILAAAHHGDLAFVEHNLGLAFAALGDHPAAVAHYAAAAALYADTIGDAPAAIRLHLDRARSHHALHQADLARAELARAIALVDQTAVADRASIAWIADDSRALLAMLASPAHEVTRPIVVERGPDVARPPPPQTHAPLAPIPDPAAPHRDVGVYGSSQTW